MPVIEEQPYHPHVNSLILRVVLMVVGVVVAAALLFWFRFDIPFLGGTPPKTLALDVTRDIQQRKYTELYNLTSSSYRATSDSKFLLTAQATALRAIYSDKTDPAVTQHLNRFKGTATTRAAVTKSGKPYYLDIRWVRESGHWKAASINPAIK